MKLVVTVGALAALVAAPASAQDSAVAPMALARAHLAAHNLDSAAAIFRRVAEAPGQSVPDRIQAWVMLGVVDFYRSGDSAAAAAFRHALELDPGFEVAALAQFDPAIDKILAVERAALASRAELASRKPGAAEAPPVYECLGKCPDGVWPPHVTSFPQIEFPMNASVGVHDTRMRTFLLFEGVVSADGVIEPETLIMTGGTARGTESELRRGLAQARFSPGRARGVPVRTRIRMRFDFEAEGTAWVKYTYRVMVR
jgi:hypothetical protein